MSPTLRFTSHWLVLAFVALAHGAGSGQPAPAAHRPIPLSLLEEHAEIVTTLRSAEREGGALGHAAREVLAALEPHLALEQAVALPSLRLLPRLAANEVDAGMTDLIGVSERLRAELPTLRRQHRALVPRLESLYSEAWAAGRSDYAFFAQGLLRHIRVDEEVLYPAALVAGDHARVLLGRGLSD